ncbi:MAG: T9SS type A sorting domain-containing protein [Chitinophagaceae bacterium]
MKKIIIIQFVVLICSNVFSQNIKTYRYPQLKGILVVPKSGKIMPALPYNKIPSHHVPDFHGSVPKGIPVFNVGGENAKVEKFTNINSPASCLNYQGLNDAEIAYIATPPDVGGSVGITNVMVTTNNGVKIQDLATGAAQLINTLSGFFSSLNPSNPFDPKTLYDPFNNRWIVTCPDHPQDITQSRLLLAVSQTDNPLGSWYFYAIDADPSNTTWFDYPSVGFNRNWIVISGNMYAANAPNPTNMAVFAINKQTAYSGILNVTRFSLNWSTFGAFIQPCVTYDNSENTEWLINDWNGNNGGNGSLRLYTITGTPNAPILNTPNLLPTVNTTWYSDRQIISTFGCSSVDAANSRTCSLILQGGSLWAVQKIGLPTNSPTRASTQWWEINPTNGGVAQFGRIDDATGANMYFNPSLAVNINRDVLIGYSHFSNSQYPRASYSFRAGTDPLNTLQSNFDYQNSARMECNTSLYPYFERWGDYSSTTISPNNINLWTLQEYMPSGFTFTGAGTWWAEVCPADCPANYTFTLPISTPNIKYEVSNSIIASSIVNPPNGFVEFDAGQFIQLNPGFSTDITSGYFSAYIDGCGGMLPNKAQIANTEINENMYDTSALKLEKNFFSFDVYPNPAHTKANIDLYQVQSGTININILNNVGVVVKHIQQNTDKTISKQHFEIDMSNLSNGIYFIQVINGKEITTEKIIKN